MKKSDIVMLAEQMLMQNYNHNLIVKGYNSIKPLPVGYMLKTTDNWCAAFVSFLMWKCSGGAQNLPYECSCGRMIELAKGLKIWVEDESVIPKEGWLCFYDWQDKGTPRDNTGWSDHVGIITEVGTGSFKVIEGNYNNRIGKRAVKINAKGLRGFAAIKYENEQQKPLTIDEVAQEVICGLWGSGKTRKQRLTDAGYDYKTIQKRVNELMKK